MPSPGRGDNHDRDVEFENQERTAAPLPPRPGTAEPPPTAVTPPRLGDRPGPSVPTQELCYFLWQRVAPRATATAEDVSAALAEVLRSEDSHFTVLWERATSDQRRLLQSLAAEEGHPLAGEYRRRHRLPAGSSVRRALLSLERGELVWRSAGRAWISEPFLARWLLWKTR